MITDALAQVGQSGAPLRQRLQMVCRGRSTALTSRAPARPPPAPPPRGPQPLEPRCPRFPLGAALSPGPLHLQRRL